MSSSIDGERQAVARLLAALTSADDLASTHADDVLPALVIAEQSGADVESDPAFVAALRHLEHCERCLDQYERLSTELAALIEAGDAPRMEPAPAPPTFFGRARERDGIIVRALLGLARSFEIVLPAPRLAPAVALLEGEGEQILFTGALDDIPGSPRLSIGLAGDRAGPTLTVVIRDSVRRRWHVQLEIDNTTLASQTDAGGVVEFTGLAPQVSQSITVRCVELTESDDQ
jgi:hypothetical protein